jgi:phage shock protein E
MKTLLKIGMAVLIMSILSHLLFGRNGNKDVDIPALINDGALVIDVRSAGEFSGGNIQNSINIPHPVISHEIADHAPDKNQALIVYCFSGARSAAAKKSLESIGFTQVINGGSLSDMSKLLNP